MSEQEPDVARLEADIKTGRAELSASLDELGDKVNVELDPGTSVRRFTFPLCGAAALAGFWLAPQHERSLITSSLVSVISGAVTTVAGTMLGRALTMGVESLAPDSLPGIFGNPPAVIPSTTPTAASGAPTLTEVYRRTTTGVDGAARSVADAH